MRVCSKICKECPFSNTSAKGYLGPHTIVEIMECIQWEVPFTCHMHRDHDSSMDDIDIGKLPVCRGFIACANKSFKLFGSNQKYGKDLRALQDLVKSEDSDLSGVLSMREFRKYHNVNFD